jgi:hypothetical protein
MKPSSVPAQMQEESWLKFKNNILFFSGSVAIIFLLFF